MHTLLDDGGQLPQAGKILRLMGGRFLSAGAAQKQDAGEYEAQFAQEFANHENDPPLRKRLHALLVTIFLHKGLLVKPKSRPEPQLPEKKTNLSGRFLRNRAQGFDKKRRLFCCRLQAAESHCT
jgi:hypothetical protein